MDRTALLFTGLILLVAGFLLFLALNPAFTSLSSRFAGLESPTLTKAEFQYYTLLDVFAMPLCRIFIAIAVTLLLLAAFVKEAK